MKHIKNIIGKILLFVMFSFVVHDYLVGQTDLVHEAAVTQCHIATACQHQNFVEHQVFHILAINDTVPMKMGFYRKTGDEFHHETLFPQTNSHAFFVPPKHA